jgi:hypothetical protein
MTPLPDKTLYAFLVAALALVLAAPAGARPSVGPTTDDLASHGWGAAATYAKQGAAEVPIPDAFERAVTAQAPSDGGTALNGVATDRKQVWNDYYGPGSAGPVISTAGGGATKTSFRDTPLWEKALMARSRAMNEYYGTGSSGVTRQGSAVEASNGLSKYGWGAAATYAKQTAPSGRVPKSRTITAGELVVTHERGYPTYRSSAPLQETVEPKSRTITAGELVVTHERGYPTYRSSAPLQEPDWLKSLNARSQAMNDYYGAGSAGPVRPDDRATPRPVDTGVVATGDSSNGIAWEDVTAGALGGFGVALLLGLGGFALIHFHRRSSTIAH